MRCQLIAVQYSRSQTGVMSSTILDDIPQYGKLWLCNAAVHQSIVYIYTSIVGICFPCVLLMSPMSYALYGDPLHGRTL